MKLRDIFDIAADAYQEGSARFEKILKQAKDAAPWYWVIGPKRGRPAQLLLEDSNSIRFRMMRFPVLRQVYPSLIANEIVSVQPMTAPVGSIFFMDHQYSNKKTNT